MKMGQSSMDKLWREAVLKVFKGKCFFCGADYRQHEVECHHRVKRNHFLLKYDWGNGVPCCKWTHEGNYEKFGMACHQYAETTMGKLIMDCKLNKKDYLRERSGSSKQWLVERGLTKQDFLKIMQDELKGIINDEL